MHKNVRGSLGKLYLVTALLALLSQQAFAIAPAKKFSSKDMKELAGSCLDLLKKFRRAPSMEELSSQSGIAVKDLRKHAKDIPSVLRLAKKVDRKSLEDVKEQLARDVAKQIQESLRFPSTEDFLEELQLAEDKEVALELFKILFDSAESVIQLARTMHPAKFDKAREKLTNAYIRATKKLEQTPSDRDVAVYFLGEPSAFQQEYYDRMFGKSGLFPTRQDLKQAAFEKRPNAFEYVQDTDIYNDEAKDRMIEAMRKADFFMVTTAVAGSDVDIEMLRAMEKRCKEENGIILVFPANMQTTSIDKALLDSPYVHILINDVELTPWLRLYNIPIMAKQMNPHMNLDELGKRGQSLVIGHPKMDEKVIPTNLNEHHHHRLISTGAITIPQYKARRFIGRRTDFHAEDRHRMGFVMLEKTNSNKLNGTGVTPAGDFHMRQVRYYAPRKGFYDKAKFYTEDSITEERLLGVLLGDTHVGFTNQIVMRVLRETVLPELKPLYLIFEDWIDMRSINHHEKDNTVSRARRIEDQNYSLRDELNDGIAFINSLTTLLEELGLDTKILLKYSNHPAWLYDYLDKEKYKGDIQNHAMATELVNAMHKGIDPWDYVLDIDRCRSNWMSEDKDSILPRSLLNRVNHPERLEAQKKGDPKIIGPKDNLMDVGNHGHAGANGAKGSLATFDRSADNSMTGHTHVIAVKGDHFNVGLTGRLKVGYNDDGPSSWTIAFGGITMNGHGQIYVFKRNEFYSDADEKPNHANQFYYPNYPKVKPNNGETPVRPGDGGQIDQWTQGDTPQKRAKKSS
ncbi:MAG: hypothetical protein AB7F43_08035 [Bacteriovoracia bacterium]